MSTALVGDFSTAFVLSHSGARTALPMGVAPEIKLNCLQLRLNSIFLQSKSLLPMGVKKGLDLESRLALCDLLCIRPVWLTVRVCSALGASWMLLYSNAMFEFVQLVGLLSELIQL